MDIEQYWKDFKDSNNIKENQPYGHYFFCDNEKDADELAELVKKGVKRATASNLWLFEATGEPLPKAGDYNVITDFSGRPQCIVKTTKVDICAFRDVPASFARREGEGDGSLQYWREGHKRFFTRECQSIGRKFSEELPVVLEQFEVVHI